MEMQHPLDFITLDEQIQDMTFAMKEKYSNHRMYILVRESIPLGKAINSVAHGAIGANDLWMDMDEYRCWKAYSYKKVTCKLSDEEFKLINKVIDENQLHFLEQIESTLGGFLTAHKNLCKTRQM